MNPSSDSLLAKLEAIRMRCVEANPGITRETERVLKGKRTTVNVTRQIRMADLFIALGRFGNFTHPTVPDLQDGQVTKEWKDALNLGLGNVITILEVITRWNKYSDSLDAQSSETIDFLHSLLCK